MLLKAAPSWKEWGAVAVRQAQPEPPQGQEQASEPEPEWLQEQGLERSVLRRLGQRTLERPL
jgi:hypothetical protein